MLCTVDRYFIITMSASSGKLEYMFANNALCLYQLQWP